VIFNQDYIEYIIYVSLHYIYTNRRKKHNPIIYVSMNFQVNVLIFIYKFV